MGSENTEIISGIRAFGIDWQEADRLREEQFGEYTKEYNVDLYRFPEFDGEIIIGIKSHESCFVGQLNVGRCAIDAKKIIKIFAELQAKCPFLKDHSVHDIKTHVISYRD